MTTTFRSELSRLGAALALGSSVLLAGAGCSSCEDKAAPAADAAVVELGVVPAPEGILAEIHVRSPGEAWTKLRALGGGVARLLPQSFGLLVTTMLGLPAAVADGVDAELPLTGVVLADPKGGEPGPVLSVHVKSGRELVTRLTTGADAPYSARPDPSGLTLLEPKPGKASAELSLAVAGNYLIAGKRSSDVAKAGAYVAGTLPKQPAPALPVQVSVPKAALSGSVAKLLRETWREKRAELEKLDRENRQRHGGRTPDFGDPAAALRGLDSTVEGFAKVLETAAGGSLTLEPFEDRLEVRAEVTADQAGAARDLVSGMTVGDAKPLLALPKSTPIAVLSRSSGAQRQASAKSIAEGVSDLFGDRLTTPDRDKIRQALEQLASGRGDAEAYAVLIEGTNGGLIYSAPTTDPKAFDAGAKAVARLLSLKPVSEPLREFVGETNVKLSNAVLPGIPGTVERALVTIKPSAMRGVKDKSGKLGSEPQNLEALWQVRDGRASVVISPDAVPVLGTLLGVQADPKATHAADDKTKQALSRVSDASFVLFAQPLRLNLGQSATLASSSPLVASFGRKGDAAYLRLDADQLALEALLKMLFLGRQ